jgi:hypothetical protein
MDKLDILAYLDKLEENISLLRKEIKEIKIVFDKLPDIAEKDKEVLATFLSKIKNSVDDVKIELSNFELFLKVGFDKVRNELKEDLNLTINNSLTRYFEKELPKVLYVVQKVLIKNQNNLIEEVVKKAVEEKLNPLKEEINQLKDKIDVLTLIDAKEKEDKLKLLLLTTKKKEIKKQDLEKSFGKDIVNKVLRDLGDVIKVKIV